MIEELKLLIPLLQSAGVGAMWVAFGMMAAELLKWTLLMGTAAWVVYKTVWAYTQNIGFQHEGKRRIALLEAYGYGVNSGYYNDEQLIQLQRLLAANPFKKP